MRVERYPEDDGGADAHKRSQLDACSIRERAVHLATITRAAKVVGKKSGLSSWMRLDLTYSQFRIALSSPSSVSGYIRRHELAHHAIDWV